MPPTSQTAIKGLGEIALRVKSLDNMVQFYEQKIRLKLMHRSESVAFFEIAPGHEGHTQVLALFDRSSVDGYVAPESKRTSIDHLAFNISLADLESEHQRLELLGLKVTTADHLWVKWRSLYVHDPEGNIVELVCYDATMSDESPSQA